jgi:hypothetical protein
VTGDEIFHEGADVPARKRELVVAAGKWLVSEGVSIPRYVCEWIAPCSLDPFDVACGVVANRRESPMRFSIRVDLEDEETFLTATHELVHISDICSGRYSTTQLEARAYGIEARAKAIVTVPALCPLSTIVPELRRLHEEARVNYARADAATLGVAEARASEYAQALIEVLALTPKDRDARLLRLKAEGRRALALT